MEEKPEFVAVCEAAVWRGDGMSLLQFLRKSNKGNIIRFIVEAFRREHGLTKNDELDQEELATWTTGQKVIADMLWRVNDRCYGQ